MEHKGFYLMEHKDTKTQRFKQSLHSAWGSAWKNSAGLRKKISVSLRLCVLIKEKTLRLPNFVSSCLCVQLKTEDFMSSPLCLCVSAYIINKYIKQTYI